jgi:hypothetical protein
MKLFQAALPDDMRNMVAQKDSNMITLAQMYDIATTTKNESNYKKISVIENTEETDLDDNNITSF